MWSCRYSHDLLSCVLSMLIAGVEWCLSVFSFILFIAVNNIQCRQFMDGNIDFYFPCQGVQAMVTWIEVLNAIHWQYGRFFIAFGIQEMEGAWRDP